MPGLPPPPGIADAWLIAGSHVIEVVFADGLRGAADLRDMTPGGAPDIVGDGSALRWHDGTTVTAQALLARVLRSPMRLPPMSAGEFARWADDDGSDVRWELQRGSPIPRPGGSLRHSDVVGALSARLFRVKGWLVPTHTWVGGSPADTDLRMVDIAVVPNRPDAEGDLPWWDNAMVVEVSEAATAYMERERLLALRRLPSLREIAVVGTGGEWARIERRADGDRWRLEEVGPGGVLRLSSVGVEIPLADLRRERA